MRCEDHVLLLPQRMIGIGRLDDEGVECGAGEMATGAVFLTAGLATLSWPIVGTGLFALVASVLVDEHHKRGLGRLP